jgi:hypothetical protein
MNLKKSIGDAFLAGAALTSSGIAPRTSQPQDFWKYYIVYGPDGKSYRVRKWIP